MTKRLALLLCSVVALCLCGLATGQEPAASSSTTATERTGATQTVHILVGHSVVLRTDSKLKRVLVGNPAVVSTTTTAPSELVITATAPGSSSVVLWQDDNSSRIVEVFSDMDVSMLRDALHTGFPKESVNAEAEEGRVVLTGTVSSQAVADQIGKMAAPFTKDVVNTIRVTQGRSRQILLKVRFAEVDRTKLQQFGINLLSTGAANTIGTISTQQFGSLGLGTEGKLTGQIGGPLKGTTTTETVSDLLNIFLFRPDLNLGATIKALQQQNVLQILAEPNLMAADGQPATFLAGGELPYPVVSGVLGQSTVSVQFKPFGVKLEFTGTIEADNIVRLKVYPEVSSLDFANAITVSGFVLPAIATRNATTVVELKDGQSFGIAGLLDQRTTAQFSKVPGIGDIPILGQLFRSRSVNRSNSELMVIVTPVILDPSTMQTAEPTIPMGPLKSLDKSEFDKKIPGGSGGK
jgi:pilus assembly protein CpaC